MVASGCSAEQIAAVVKASLAKNTNAERQARYRDRNKASQVTESNVTAATSHSPDKEKSPTPPKEINPNPSLRSQTARGTRLPADWVLPSAWGRWAQSEGYPEPMIRREAERFANFWQSKAGKDATKIDWEKTWRNWMLKFDRPRSSSAAPPRQTAFQQRHQSAIDAFDRKLGLKPNDEFASGNLDLEPADWRAH
jgi:hypothetical protein